MAEEGNCRGISGDAPAVFNDAGATLLDRLTELAGTVMPVDALTYVIAGGEIQLAGWTHNIAWNLHGNRRTL